MGKYEKNILPRLKEIKDWARDGMIEKDIAKMLKVAYSTFRVYKEDPKPEYDGLRTALAEGENQANDKVENSLFKRALGYKYEEKTFENVWNDKLKKYIKVNTKTVTKEIAPDVAAQIFWLNNRRPDYWKNKQLTQVTVSDLAKYLDGLKGKEF